MNIEWIEKVSSLYIMGGEVIEHGMVGLIHVETPFWVFLLCMLQSPALVHGFRITWSTPQSLYPWSLGRGSKLVAKSIMIVS